MKKAEEDPIKPYNKPGDKKKHSEPEQVLSSGRYGKPSGKYPPPKLVGEVDFIVHRNDNRDIFKPYSEEAVSILGSWPFKTKLDHEESSLLQAVATDLERSTSVERIVPDTVKPRIPENEMIELIKMPTWLGSMITNRYELIKKYFKADTASFFHSLNSKIDREYRPEFAFFEGVLNEREIIVDQDEKDNTKMQSISEREKKVSEVDPESVFRLTRAIGKWKRTKLNESIWNPIYVSKVAKKLRADLTLKPAEADVQLTTEDVVHRHHSESEDSEFDETGKPKWEVIKRRERAQKAADHQMDIQFLKPPKKKAKLKKYMNAFTPAIQKLAKKKIAELKRKEKESRKKLNRAGIRRALFTRGHFRRYDRLLYKGCGEHAPKPHRLEYHYRSDDNFHQYVVAIVGSGWFRFFIMSIIMLNALVLAIEPLDEEENYTQLFEVIDEVFLAIYVIEACLKIYAHPLKYWASGFNIFDFVILIISLTKTIIDWADLADIAILRVLLIVRALRILRGISLSVQLQVLVAALVQTIKTHVLSVVLLLVLLLYIAAIVAHYLFSDNSEKLRESWEFVPNGMFRMVIFVTMDGWIDIMEEFEQIGLVTFGRVFNLICIVLGNFMFYNIFIAIIILNISEATDMYRERIRREKQEIVRRKKDNVFRRQKLDMRQLLARQKKTASADFYHLTSHFQRLLRHDDLVLMDDVCTSPLWIDCLQATLMRTYHTSNLLMNLHREMADNLVAISRLHSTGHYETKTLRRSRYHRYMKLKAKLTLLKTQLVDLREKGESKLRIRYKT